MDRVMDRLRSGELESNRWILPVAGILLAGLTIGLAVMFVAPMLRKQDLRSLQKEGRGIKRRTQSKAGMVASQVKGAVEDVADKGKQVVESAADTLQEQTAKVKKTARKKANDLS